MAYVIFTSGSTGVPKGVMISRQALAHYVSWIQSSIQPRPEDRWSQHPNIAFDLSVLDIYGALCFGAALYPLNGRMDRLMPGLAVKRHQLTIWNSVPSVVGLMMGAGQMSADNLASLRLMSFCGEPLLPEHLDAIFKARPDLSVFNTYGPTEATVSCTLLPLSSTNYRRYCGQSVSIGSAIAGMKVLIHPDDGRDEGELVIAGPQLADGYWNDPEKTTHSFRETTIQGKKTCAYFTGDWARRLADGSLYFDSRIDRQVKLNGFRIELGEVDSALRKCGFTTSCALVHGGALHAFLEGTLDNFDEALLREQLASLLEPYAVPKSFHLMAQLPRNDNDKLDVGAMAALLTPSAPVH